MSTEDLVEEFLDVGYKAYKKIMKGTVEYTKLSKHEPVTIEGREFNYLREYVIFELGAYITENLPEATVEVFLEGNNSSLKLTMNDSEQEEINQKMETFLAKFRDKFWVRKY